ncbi:DUF7575 domain-containing protein [Halosegnis marinus]|uniref:DUF7575 domain-containing protein n=1 Tax=Halosegnis marinus TaxID=3034023 RepID=UPI00361AAA14
MTAFAMVDAFRLAEARMRTDDDTPRCPSCGKELDGDLDFCPWCTADLSGE